MGSGPSRGVASPRGSRSRVASSSSRLAASSGEVRSTGAHAAPRVGLADGRASGPGETATSRGQPVSSPVTSSLRKGEGEGGRGRPGRRWRVSACFVTRPRRVHATRVRGRGTHHAYPAARSTARCTASASTFPGPRRDATWSHSAETRTRIEARASRCERAFSAQHLLRTTMTIRAFYRSPPAANADERSNRPVNVELRLAPLAKADESDVTKRRFCRCPRRLHRGAPCPHYERPRARSPLPPGSRSSCRRVRFVALRAAL